MGEGMSPWEKVETVVFFFLTIFIAFTVCLTIYYATNFIVELNTTIQKNNTSNYGNNNK